MRTPTWYPIITLLENRTKAAPGDAVVQPGTLDLTGNELTAWPTLADLENQTKVAELEAVVELDFTTANNIPINHVDAALAKLTNSGRSHDDIDRVAYGGCIRGTAAYVQDEPGAIGGSARVYKVGRTTGYTEGVVK